MSAVPPAGTEGLPALLRDEKALLDEFLALTREQAELLASDDAAGFKASLDKRRELIARIDVLRAKTAGPAEPHDEAAVAALRAAIRETLREIEEKNKANGETAEKQMARLGDEIKKLSLSQKGLEGYGRIAPSGSSEYFDRKM